MRRELCRIPIKSRVHATAEGQLNILDTRIQFAKLRREIQALLHQQIFDGFLQRALTFDEKCLEIVLGKRIA